MNWQGKKGKDSNKIERQCQWEKHFFRAENMDYGRGTNKKRKKWKQIRKKFGRDTNRCP